MRKKFTVRAPAKINLGLTVLGRRADGYHEIESVMQQVSLADILLFEPSPKKGWSFFCTDPDLSGYDNLVCQAAKLLEEQSNKPLPGVKITLFKRIPVEAGLAGGSSDAAAVLLALNSYWQLGLAKTDLLEIGSALGSDVPYCLQGGTSLVRGRGEIIEELPSLPLFWVVLALPRGVKISTASAYRSFDSSSLGKPSLIPLVKAIRLKNRKKITDWLSCGLTNTLETAILPGSDLLSSLKKRLQYLGLKPILSGSGPTLFILTEYYSLARSAARAVEEVGGRAYLCWTLTGGKEW